jgi:hypothetical protein
VFSFPLYSYDIHSICYVFLHINTFCLTTVHNTALQNPAALSRSDFMFLFCYLFATSLNVHHSSSLLYCKSQNTFRPNWAVIKCTCCVLKEFAVLLFYCNCIGPFLCYYRAVAMHVFGLSVISLNDVIHMSLTSLITLQPLKFLRQNLNTA